MRHIKYLIISAVILLASFTYGAGAERREFTAATDRNGVQRVEILGGAYFFDPYYIIVKVNVPVELKIRKEGIMPHNFVLKAPDAGIDIAVDLGTEPTVVNFTATKAGTYPFYCDKKFLFMSSHKEKGMEGTFEVRE